MLCLNVLNFAERFHSEHRAAVSLLVERALRCTIGNKLAGFPDVGPIQVPFLVGVCGWSRVGLLFDGADGSPSTSGCVGGVVWFLNQKVSFLPRRGVWLECFLLPDP